MVILERPKLAPFRPEMRRRMAEVLLLPVERVTVKATTAEGMGDVGQGLSCVAHAVATLSQAEDA
jgi:2-C-methyl-D-erythritol 2,4-cyclodiphosphate synthase